MNAYKILPAIRHEEVTDLITRKTIVNKNYAKFVTFNYDSTVIVINVKE